MRRSSVNCSSLFASPMAVAGIMKNLQNYNVKQTCWYSPQVEGRGKDRLLLLDSKKLVERWEQQETVLRREARIVQRTRMRGLRAVATPGIVATLSPVHEPQMGTIPVLSLAEVATRLQEYNAPRRKPYGAMYSSVVGGITLDPAAMVLPLDDHMVHRGHAVFDTATISDGHLYELDAHLDRLLRSASKAKLTPPFSRSTMRDILVQTAAASGCREGTLRYWLSAGPGGFGLSPTECERSFYAVVITERHDLPTEGVKVITSTVPIKPPQFATMKSTNYLPNAHVVMEAEEKGAFQGIWLDQEGFIAEAANMNVVFVKEGELLVPPFVNILPGCTAKRLLALAQNLISNAGSNESILKGIKEAKITVEEGKAADEMMLVVSSYLVIPVLVWDEQPIGNGTVGPVTKALVSMMQKDVLEGPSDVREPVPYRQ